MSPRNTFSFLCLYVALLGLALVAPNNQAAFFTSVFAAVQAQPVVIEVSATNDSPPTGNPPKRVGESVTLTATVNVDPALLTFRWQFGDGQTEDGNNRVVHHAYAAEGNYTAVVIVSGAANTPYATTDVFIFGLGGNTTPPEGLAATCSGPIVANNSTSCVASVEKGDNVIFTWNFNDGSAPIEGPSISHIYTTPGTHTVTVSARNIFGTASPETIQVQVTEQPVTGLSIESNTPIRVGVLGIFTATVKTGTNVQYVWTLGDGNQEIGQVVYHRYAQAGSYNVSVHAFNSFPGLSIFKPIRVLPLPISNFTVINDGPKSTDEEITFIATAISNDIVTYYWNWGDGSSQQGPESTVKHKYKLAGKYPVVVIAADSTSALIQSMIAYVAIQPPFLPDLKISWSPEIVVPGNPVKFQVANILPGYAYQWDWGDGSPQGTGITVTHTYALSKNYVVSVRGTKPGGENKEADFVVIGGSKLYFPIVMLFGSNPGGQSGGGDQPTPLDTATAAPTPPLSVATSTDTPTPTSVSTATDVPSTPTVVPTDTPMDTATATFIPGGGTVPQTATATPIPTDTEALPPTNTEVPIPTATNTPDLGGTVPRP